MTRFKLASLLVLIGALALGLAAMRDGSDPVVRIIFTLLLVVLFIGLVDDRDREPTRLLSRFTQSWIPRALAAFGGASVVLGYLYGLAYAGIPYPADAPIELQLQYDRNRLFAERICLVGFWIFVVGVALLVAQFLIRRISGREGRGPDHPLSCD